MNAATKAMNDATQSMAASSYWSTVIVGIGTVLLLWTLFETRKATVAARTAVEVTRGIGQAQIRAYLSVAPEDIPRLGELGEIDAVPFRISIENNGSSPARHVRHLAKVVTVDERLPDPCEDLGSEAAPQTSGGAIAPGVSLVGSVNGDFTYADLYAIQVEEDGRMPYLAGVVFYRDVFEREYKLRFSYRITVETFGHDYDDEYDRAAFHIRMDAGTGHNDEREINRI